MILIFMGQCQKVAIDQISPWPNRLRLGESWSRWEKSQLLNLVGQMRVGRVGVGHLQPSCDSIFPALQQRRAIKIKQLRYVLSKYANCKIYLSLLIIIIITLDNVYGAVIW